MEFSLANHLYLIGKKLSENRNASSLSLNKDKYELIQNYLTTYKLDEKDIYIIAFCWYKAIAEQDNYLNTFSIIEKLFQSEKNQFVLLPRFLTLLNKNVLYCEKKTGEERLHQGRNAVSI